MDDEAREVSELTKDELAARFDAGKPAKVRKSEDFVQRMKRVVDESTKEGPEPVILWPSGQPTDRIILRRTEFAPIRAKTAQTT